MLGQNGIFEKAKEAVEKYKNAEEDEGRVINKLSEQLEEINILTGLKIGDTVNYEPKENTYTWKKEYCSSGNEVVSQSNVNKLESDVELSNKNDEFKVIEWKVFDINKKNGIITLISANPTKGTVYLGGAQGYNNAVKLLNDACNTLYGNNEKNINGRNIKIEDIENNMNSKTLNEIHNFIHPDENSTTKYGEQVKDAFTVFKYYPSIYKKELKSEIDNQLNQTGLDRSEQDELIRENDYSATNGLLVANTSIKPYQTYWELGNKGKLQKELFNDETIYSLLISQGNNTKYFIASRAINTRNEKKECDFNLWSIKGEGVLAGSPFIYRQDGISDYWKARILL